MMHERTISSLIRSVPYAEAFVKGNHFAPNLGGSVRFFPWASGTIVKAEIMNLPEHKPAVDGSPQIGPFGFHIHEGGTCIPNERDDSFQMAGAHYNPGGMPHPEHAGDLPVLFSNDGYAYMVVFTNRFRPEEIIGRTVMIHQSPDDYRTQPAGNSGTRIACGVIRKVY